MLAGQLEIASSPPGEHQTPWPPCLYGFFRERVLRCQLSQTGGKQSFSNLSLFLNWLKLTGGFTLTQEGKTQSQCNWYFLSKPGLKGNSVLASCKSHWKCPLLPSSCPVLQGTFCISHSSIPLLRDQENTKLTKSQFQHFYAAPCGQQWNCQQELPLHSSDGEQKALELFTGKATSEQKPWKDKSSSYSS